MVNLICSNFPDFCYNLKPKKYQTCLDMTDESAYICENFVNNKEMLTCNL